MGKKVEYTSGELTIVWQPEMCQHAGIWLNGRLSCEQIEQLWCELIIPEQNK